MAAADEAELVHMVATAGRLRRGPDRLPLSARRGVGVDMPESGVPLAIGKGRIVREGDRDRHPLPRDAPRRGAEGGRGTRGAGPVDDRRRRPLRQALDEELILRLAREHEVLITVEEGSIGGFGSHVLQLLADAARSTAA